MGESSIPVRILFLILFLSSLVIVRVPFCQAQVTPDVYVDPPSTTVNFGSDFSVNVSVANVADLGGWEFKLYFGNNALSIMSATEGPFLKQGGSTGSFLIDITNNYNATHGRVWMTTVLMGGGSGVTGSGTLATISFHASSSGNTTLSLVDTVLGDSQANPITHTTNNGTVRVIATIDIAITNVTPYKTVVGQGYTMSITVTAANRGNQNATFNVTVYANTTTIETQTVNSMPNGTSTILAFIWNTTGFAYGNYSISAYASPVEGETDTGDNTFVDGVVTVVLAGDLNDDGIVDYRDINRVARMFGKTLGDPQWDPNSDIIEDGIIDYRDINVPSRNYGKTRP
jgi:hypothetical protein